MRPANRKPQKIKDRNGLTADGNLLTRRSLLGMAGLGAVAWMLPKGLLPVPAGRIPIAVQLYSVRGDCSRNFDAALERIAKMGFDAVEFAGYYGYQGKPKELKARLDELSLRVSGTHIGLDVMQGDALKNTIEFHQATGCRFLIVPGAGGFTDPEKSKGLAEVFNRIAETLKPLGMACGYHNHTGEFKKEGDKTYWELFAERTSQDVILQQDCGWTAAAGLDPVVFIRKYPGRTRTVHFKPTVMGGDTAKKAIIGQDSVDWAKVYAACSSVGGTEWIVIEQEQYPDNKSAMECTEQSLAGLKKILAGMGE